MTQYERLRLTSPNFSGLFVFTLGVTEGARLSVAIHHHLVTNLKKNIKKNTCFSKNLCKQS